MRSRRRRRRHVRTRRCYRRDATRHSAARARFDDDLICAADARFIFFVCTTTCIALFIRNFTRSTCRLACRCLAAAAVVEPTRTCGDGAHSAYEAALIRDINDEQRRPLSSACLPAARSTTSGERVDGDERLDDNAAARKCKFAGRPAIGRRAAHEKAPASTWLRSSAIRSRPIFFVFDSNFTIIVGTRL